MKFITMNIFHAVFLLIFVILVSSSNAALSTINQTSGPPSGNDDKTFKTQSEIQEETIDDQQSAPTPSSSTRPKNNKIPDKVLKFFNDPELPEEDYLDSKIPYKESDKDNLPSKTSIKKSDIGDLDSSTPESDKREQIPFKKVFEEFQKFVPFVVQREKYKGLDTFYFPASHLTVKPLTIDDASKYEKINQLKKIIGGKEIKYDFEHYQYYDWWFTSIGEKRLIPACPRKEEVIKKFPSGKIMDPKKENNILTVPWESLEQDRLSSDDETDTEIEDPSSNPTPAEISSSGQPLPRSNSSSDENPQPDSPNSTPTTSPRAKQTLPKSNFSKNKQPSSSSNAPINLFKDKGSQLSGWHSFGKTSKSNMSRMGNTFEGRILKVRKIFQKNEYMASEYPCEYEVKPTFVKEEEGFYTIDAYYAGYMVEFNKKVTALYANFLKHSDKMLWFHVAHLMRTQDTKDTFAIFNYSPVYESVRKMKNIPIYTDYTVNKYSHATAEDYEYFYSIENQRKIFESISHHEKYFDEENSLFFVKQELMDQKSVPTMAYKRVALDYMNIAPMYKIIKDNTWRKVENVVLKLPMVTSASTVMFVTGTYGKLLINGKPIYLDDGSNSKDEKKTKKIRVPYAFYKIVHVTYDSSRDGKLLREHQKFFFNIVIVTHNDPFETEPEKICDMPVQCERIGWTKVVQKNPALGFTYCCAFTKKFADKFGIGPMYESIQTAPLDDVQLGLLDLRVLWYVEENESTRELERDEFPLMRREPPIYE